MVLRMALTLTDKGYARWRDNTGFLQNLENNRKLTDAEVKVLEGQAQMFRQSGYKVDVTRGKRVSIHCGVTPRGKHQVGLVQ